MFHPGADVMEGEFVYGGVGEVDGVGVAHGDAGDRYGTVCQFDGVVLDDSRAVIKGDRDLGGEEPGWAHGGSDGRYAAVVAEKLNLTDRAESLDYQSVLGR